MAKRIDYMSAESNRIEYWCNALGELSSDNRNITEAELPVALRTAYRKLWYPDTGIGALCYLVGYEGNYYVALLNEYDHITAVENEETMDKLYAAIERKAKEMDGIDIFDDALIIVGQNTGFFECHELLVLMPWNTEPSKFDAITDWLNEHVYEI